MQQQFINKDLNELQNIYNNLDDSTKDTFQVYDPKDVVYKDSDPSIISRLEDQFAIPQSFKTKITCKFCQNIMINPAICQNCSSMQCQSCTFKTQSRQCQKCLQCKRVNQLERMKLPIIKKLAFTCECFQDFQSKYQQEKLQHQNDIRWSMDHPEPQQEIYNLSTYYQHINSQCDFTKTRCPLQCKHLTGFIRKRDMKYHFHQDCSEIYINCQNCNISMKRKQALHHDCIRDASKLYKLDNQVHIQSISESQQQMSQNQISQVAVKKSKNIFSLISCLRKQTESKTKLLNTQSNMIVN